MATEAGRRHALDRPLRLDQWAWPPWGWAGRCSGRRHDLESRSRDCGQNPMVPAGGGEPRGDDSLAPDGTERAMNRPTGHIAETLPFETRRLVVQVRERFEGAWRDGGRPRIEPYLEGLGPLERAAVLRELVAVELSLRLEGGDRPTLGELVARFPDDAAQITCVFESTIEATADYRPDRRGLAGRSVSDGEKTAALPDGSRTTEVGGRVPDGRLGTPPRWLGAIRSSACWARGLRPRLPGPRRRAGPRRGDQGRRRPGRWRPTDGSRRSWPRPARRPA